MTAPGPSDPGVTMSTLTTGITDGPAGPVVVVAGEVDATSATELNQFLAAQLADGTPDLTIDVSGLRFADSVTIGALVRAALVVTDRGGTLTLLHPPPEVARILSITGVDAMLTIREKEQAEPDPGG